MSNESKSDLFLPLPLNWMDEQIQCIPSQDPMFTKSDRCCLFTRLHSSWSQCNYKIVQHATFWKKQNPVASQLQVVAEENCFRYDFFLTLNSSGYRSKIKKKIKNRLLKKHIRDQDFHCLKRQLERRESGFSKHQDNTVIKLIISRVSV